MDRYTAHIHMHERKTEVLVKAYTSKHRHVLKLSTMELVTEVVGTKSGHRSYRYCNWTLKLLALNLGTEVIGAQTGY